MADVWTMGLCASPDCGCSGGGGLHCGLTCASALWYTTVSYSDSQISGALSFSSCSFSSPSSSWVYTGTFFYATTGIANITCSGTPTPVLNQSINAKVNINVAVLYNATTCVFTLDVTRSDVVTTCNQVDCSTFTSIICQPTTPTGGSDIFKIAGSALSWGDTTKSVTLTHSPPGASACTGVSTIAATVTFA